MREEIALNLFGLTKEKTVGGNPLSLRCSFITQMKKDLGEIDIKVLREAKRVLKRKYGRFVRYFWSKGTGEVELEHLDLEDTEKVICSLY